MNLNAQCRAMYCEIPPYALSTLGIYSKENCMNLSVHYVSEVRVEKMLHNEGKADECLYYSLLHHNQRCQL